MQLALAFLQQPCSYFSSAFFGVDKTLGRRRSCHILRLAIAAVARSFIYLGLKFNLDMQQR